MPRLLSEKLTEEDISRIIEMAWEDRTPFEAIESQFGLSESQTIKLMQRFLTPPSFKMWRKRVTGRVTKHLHKRSFISGRAYALGQYKVR
jgi:uncharacterized protein (TIGR03643 family)